MGLTTHQQSEIAKYLAFHFYFIFGIRVKSEILT